jgi:hypothetical protein
LNGALGLPVRHHAQPPRSVPVARKRIDIRRIQERPSGKAPHKDEWTLDQAIYEEVIEIVQSMNKAFERSPGTTSKLKEPELRDQILIQLNGTFAGAAGGELFNGNGKTDILVRVEDRNVFIGGCKFWSGEKAIAEAIDQLLGYTVWRDTKAALVLFIRQASVSDIIEKADATIRAHRFKRAGAATGDPSVRRNFVLHQKDDENREIQAALLPAAIRKPEEAQS